MMTHGKLDIGSGGYGGKRRSGRGIFSDLIGSLGLGRRRQHARGFFGDLWSGIKSVASPVLDIGKSLVGKVIASKLGLGRRRLGTGKRRVLKRRSKIAIPAYGGSRRKVGSRVVHRMGYARLGCARKRVVRRGRSLKSVLGDVYRGVKHLGHYAIKDPNVRKLAVDLARRKVGLGRKPRVKRGGLVMLPKPVITVMPRQIYRPTVAAGKRKKKGRGIFSDLISSIGLGKKPRRGRSMSMTMGSRSHGGSMGSYAG